MKTLVSVVVPVYNAQLYLEETIKSVLDQTYENLELVLVDDGSTDFSGEICDKWGQEDKRIIVIHSANCGPSVARNKGILAARGEYILPVDSDDIILPTYVEQAAKVLDTYPDVGIVYCEAELFGDAVGKWNIPQYSLPEFLVKNCIFATSMFRKKDWEIVGGYDKEMKSGLEDYDFWLSLISLKRKVYKLQDTLFRYRKHDDSRSSKFESDKALVKETEDLRFAKHRVLYENVYYIPDDEIRVALYGAGGAGITYSGFLNSINNCSIKCCVDKNYNKVDKTQFNIPVYSPDHLLEHKYDLVIIAINKDDIYEEIRSWLLCNGYAADQVVRYFDKDIICKW